MPRTVVALAQLSLLLLCSASAAAAPPTALPADTPMTTTRGHTFVAPAGWHVTVRGPVTMVAPPEAGNAIAFVDVVAKDADAVTNADPGWLLRSQFRRKLLEVLFDGRDEADAVVAAQAKSFYGQLAADRRLLVVPAAADAAAQLAPRYVSTALGELMVRRSGASTVFDFGEWKSEVATRKNPDGTTSFVTIAPGASDFELVVARPEHDKRALVMRDMQHEYRFVER